MRTNAPNIPTAIFSITYRYNKSTTKGSIIALEYTIMTVADVQKELHIGKDKAYRLFKQKSFPSFQFDGRYLVTRKDFEHWLEKIKKLPDKNYRLGLMTYYHGGYYGY